MPVGKHKPGDPSPQSLIRLYEDALPTFMFPVGRIAGLTNSSVKEILIIATLLGFKFNPAHPELPGHQAASIVRRMFDVD